ncbi:DUF7683 domain-containing protein [Chryseobacterium lineare]
MRVIEEYCKSDGFLHKDYILNITPAEIIKTLDDLELNEDDYEDEIYDSYILDNVQIQKIKSFLLENLNEDFDKYEYLLACYSDDEKSLEKEKIKSFEEYIELNEFDRKTNTISRHYKLTIAPTEIFSYIKDIVLQNDDTLEDYELYELNKKQIKRLKNFVKNDILNEDVSKYKYYLHHKIGPNAID